MAEAEGDRSVQKISVGRNLNFKDEKSAPFGLKDDCFQGRGKRRFLSVKSIPVWTRLCAIVQTGINRLKSARLFGGVFRQSDDRKLFMRPIPSLMSSMEHA